MRIRSIIPGLIAGLILPVISIPPLEIASVTNFSLAPISTTRVYVVNAASNEPIIESLQDQPWPIASLTKVMAVLVFLEEEPDLKKTISLKKEDMVGGSSLQVPVGTSFQAADLVHATLMVSANNAAHALYRGTSLTLPEFVQKMNDKAETLGLKKTHFVEPTGLDAGNVSTPQEYARIISVALDNDYIRQTMEKPSYRMRPFKRKSFIIGNTNRFLREKTDFKVQGAKTGLIDESGFNLAVKAEKDGKSVVAVVFGKSSWDESFASAEELLLEAFSK